MAIIQSTKTSQTIGQAQLALTIMRNQWAIDRRVRQQKRIDYYFGDKQVEYLMDALKQQFLFPERLKLQPEVFNITEMIINEAAILYNEEPYRELCDATDQDKELYAELVECSKINQVMKTAQRLTKLCKTVLIRPVWRNESIEYDLYCPNMFDVIQDPSNTTKATAIIYVSLFDFQTMQTWSHLPIKMDDMQSDKAIYFYWSDTQNFIFKGVFDSLRQQWMAEILAQEGNPDNVNPYGILPFVVLRDGIPVDQFFIPGGDEIVQTNEINNVKLTEKNNITKMQSFSVPVRKGADTGASFILDPSMTVDLPADDDVQKGADFKFVSPDPKIQDISDDIDARVRRTAVKFNLNPERFTSSAQKSSGNALELRAFDQAKQIKAEKPDWRGFEKELFELTKIVFNYHSPVKFSEECELFIDYADIEVPMTVADRDAHNMLLYDNDLLTKAEWLMEENPDIRSEDEANERLAKNAEAKQAIEKEKQDQFAAQSKNMLNQGQVDSENVNQPMMDGQEKPANNGPE